MSIFSKFTPISTALLPNAEFDDIKIALKSFLPWNWGKWQDGKEISNLENKFREYFGVENSISFSSGRVGLYAILSVIARSEATKQSFVSCEKNEIASLPMEARNDNSGKLQSAEIILQAYTTIAIPVAIKQAGFTPIYIDIDENTYNIDSDKIEEKITINTKAIIIQHTFGIPAEMDKILALCKKHSLFLIEDCAHSFGAEFSGKKVGMFGDAAFFSFGRDKIISSTSGGMVIVNNTNLVEKIKEFQINLSFPPRKWILQQLLHPLLFWCVLPIYYFFSLGKIKIFFWQKLGLISRAYTQEEKSGDAINFCGYKFPNVLASLALNQFEKIERFNAHRIKISGIYQNLFRNYVEVKMPIIFSAINPVFLYYTIQIKYRDELLKFAAKKHIILGDWFPGALGPKGVNEEKFDYKRGDCPVAERVGSKSLNLPTNIKTSKEDAEKIVVLIKEFLLNV